MSKLYASCPLPTRRFLRTLEAAEYLGMCRSQFDSKVRPHLKPIVEFGDPLWDVEDIVQVLASRKIDPSRLVEESNPRRRRAA